MCVCVFSFFFFFFIFYLLYEVSVTLYNRNYLFIPPIVLSSCIELWRDGFVDSEGRGGRPYLRYGKHEIEKWKYPLFLGRLHCFTMVLERVRDRFWNNRIINTIKQHVYSSCPTHLSVGVPLKNSITITWLLKEQMIWWCYGELWSV